ncbi:hypothetical protein PGT21_011704 [Puccinia graminis f. sp. tritici]|uniref:Uncharacterized protein n=1 Tax=Puccinia graminis f. sp. tritici TaxID=56615 RepID=A0A5B0MST8_PUCGR|nr:hypothetical protein PGT21_011704 [Puccinia graminis f. sp. tritici]
MVDANTTRATSKKIKDSSSSKVRNEDTSVADSLIPKGGAISNGGHPDNQTALMTEKGKAQSGSSLIPADAGGEIGSASHGSPVKDTVFSSLVDTSESRRDRAPVALLNQVARAKTGIDTASQSIEEEEDNSPDIAVSSLMSEREQMWKRAVAAQNSGDADLAEMLFNAIGRIGKSAAAPPTASLFAIPNQAESGEVTYLGTAPSKPTLTVVEAKGDPQDPEKFFLTEGDLVYAIGSVTNHNSVGFAPFLDENIRKLRSPLPLTIFNRKWQQRAMAYHLDRRQRSDESTADKDKSGGYKGFSFVQEWTQTYAQWSRNHRAFVKTLHDVYKIKKFSKLLATHKDNCDEITEEFGFMVAFRYDMEVRSNTFSHRITDDDVKNAIPDISQRKESVVEQCYNVCRNFGELDWEENLYAPGLSHCNHDPLTGYLRNVRNNQSFHNSFGNNTMIQNPLAQSHGWMYSSNGMQTNGMHNNTNQNSRQSSFNSYQSGPNGGNQNFNQGNKRPRGGYKGSNYSDNFVGRSDGGQSSGRKNNQNK